MSKLHIKKGDTVIVNSGEDKGKTGRVLEVLVDKKKSDCRGSEYCVETYKTQCTKPQWRHRKERSFHPYL